MAGEIELLTKRLLAGVVGYDVNGLVGRDESLAAPYIGQVATRCMPALNSPGASFTQGMSRTTHFARDRIVNPTVIYPVWRLNGTTEANAGAGTLKVSLEYPAGVFTLSNENIANGGNAVNAPNGNSAFTFNVTVPRGAKFWMRVYQVAAGGILWTQLSGGVDSAYGSAPEDGMNIGTSIADQTMGGTVVFANGIGYFPIVIAAPTRQASLIAFGTSREVGDFICDASLDVGLTAEIVGKTLGYTNCAAAGTLLSNWNSGTHTYLNQLIAAGYWSNASNEYGVNDVPGSAASVVATARATFAANLKAANPNIILIGQTLYPYNSTSDICVTKANQTIGANQTRIFTLNEAIRAGIAGEDFCWDAADGLDPFRESKYPVNFNPNAASRAPCVFTGSIAGNVLTVTAITTPGDGINRGDPVIDPATPVQGPVLVGTWIIDQPSGTPGGVGTYTLNRRYDGSGTYPKGNVSSRTLSTAGMTTADCLHATPFGRQMIRRNQGAALLSLLKRAA